MTATHETRAIAYLRRCNPKRNIRATGNGEFEMQSGPDNYGKTFWSRIAYIAMPHRLTSFQALLIDVTGDVDRIMLNMDAA